MGFQQQISGYIHQNIKNGRAFSFISITILLLYFAQACSGSANNIPPANQENVIRDSWYFCRDTLNFYQVDLSDQLVSAIDSIVGFTTLDGNKYWVLNVDPNSRRLKEFCLSVLYVEKVLYHNSQEEEREFKAFLHKGIPILIIDDRNTIQVNQEKPLVKIFNPGQMNDDWLIRLDGKRDCFELKSKSWNRVNRF